MILLTVFYTDSPCDFTEQIQIFVSALLTQSHYQFRKDGALKH